MINLWKTKVEILLISAKKPKNLYASISLFMKNNISNSLIFSTNSGLCIFYEIYFLDKFF